MEGDIQPIMGGGQLPMLTMSEYLLRKCLKGIVENDQNFSKRAELLETLMVFAKELQLEYGYRIDSSEIESNGGKIWPIYCVTLPNGLQVSWHMEPTTDYKKHPEYTKPYDGHTTEEKFKRINDYVSENNAYY